jgi:hypothetical protein
MAYGTTYPGFEEVIERLRGLVSDTELMSLSNGSRRSAYKAALDHGVLTDAEYRVAQRENGNTWEYVGD